MISNHDDVVKNKLQHGPRNAAYISHGIQDDLLKLLGNNVVSTICNRVKEAGFYSIIVDESRDCSKQEQMSFVLCFAMIGLYMSIFLHLSMLKSWMLQACHHTSNS